MQALAESTFECPRCGKGKNRTLPAFGEPWPVCKKCRGKMWLMTHPSLEYWLGDGSSLNDLH